MLVNSFSLVVLMRTIVNSLSLSLVRGVAERRAQRHVRSSTRRTQQDFGQGGANVAWQGARHRHPARAAWQGAHAKLQLAKLNVPVAAAEAAAALPEASPRSKKETVVERYREPISKFTIDCLKAIHFDHE